MRVSEAGAVISGDAQRCAEIEVSKLEMAFSRTREGSCRKVFPVPRIRKPLAFLVMCCGP